VIQGLTTRRYSEVVKELEQAYGIEKSTISEHFIEASRQRLHKLLERPLHDQALCAMMIDGACFHDQQVIVSLGITVFGQKIVLGLRQGATENATVVKQLLSDLQGRGVDFGVPASLYPRWRKGAACSSAARGRQSGSGSALSGS
jgi:putative transposase